MRLVQDFHGMVIEAQTLTPHRRLLDGPQPQCGVCIRSQSRPVGWLLMLALVPTANAQMFADVTSSAGIDATHWADKPATGIAIADFDRNGWPDVFVTGYFEDSKLFLNQGNGSFAPFPAPAAVALPNGRCGSVAAADYDNDGWPDLYIACWGSNHLLHNLHGVGFTDMTAAAGVDNQGRSEAVAWADINNDGWLDLFVGNHPLSSQPDLGDPRNLDQIFLSDGDGSFHSISSLLEPATLAKLVLAAVFTDIDLDGDQDLYVANDKHYGNTLWRNDGPGCGGWCLTDVSLVTGTERPAYSMGVTVGDYDRDGDWDLIYSSIHEQVLLQGQQAQGELRFVDYGVAAGIDYNAIGWGVLLFDANNDGWEDLFLATSQLSASNTDRLFLNQADGRFDDITADSGLARTGPTQAAAWLDYDRDGRLDLMLGHYNLAYSLNHNLAPGGHWLAIRLEGNGPVNRDAIGSLVRISTPDGGQQLRELRAGESRGGSNEPMVHFGLGAATSATVAIRWPDGLEQELGQLDVDQYHLAAYPVPGVLFAQGFE